MNYRYFLLFSALIFAQSCTAMQPQKSAFQTISNWQDVAPFAGKMVAFSSDSKFWTENTKTYLTWVGSQTKDNVGLGYISEVAYKNKEGDLGYVLFPLMYNRPGEHSIHHFLLSNINLANHKSFYLRFATQLS